MSTTEPTSRRDYFAANAPTEIPEWFQPLPPSTSPAENASQEEISAWAAGSDQRVKQREEHRFFAWRWYYAEQMIKTNPIKPGLHL